MKSGSMRAECLAGHSLASHAIRLRSTAPRLVHACRNRAFSARRSVSRSDQALALQDDETAEAASRRGWNVVGTHPDHGVSGSRERRPELNRLMNDAHGHRFDVVLVWKADRLFRSLRAMVTTLDEWAARGIGFTSATEVFDTMTVQGKLLLHIVSACGEFERGVLIERTKAGVQAARRRGVRVGRPPSRLDLDELRDLRAKGMSIRQIGLAVGVGSSTILRRLHADNSTAGIR
jgi:DNA invertase Pin-like site-specific DNA recombinase